MFFLGCFLIFIYFEIVVLLNPQFFFQPLSQWGIRLLVTESHHRLARGSLQIPENFSCTLFRMGAEAHLSFFLFCSSHRRNTTSTSFSNFQLNLSVTLTKSPTTIYQGAAISLLVHPDVRLYTEVVDARIYASATGDNPVTYLIGHCNRCGKLQSCNLPGTCPTRSPPMRPCVSNVIYNRMSKKNKPTRLLSNSAGTLESVALWTFWNITLAMYRDSKHISRSCKLHIWIADIYIPLIQINHIKIND